MRLGPGLLLLRRSVASLQSPADAAPPAFCSVTVDAAGTDGANVPERNLRGSTMSSWHHLRATLKGKGWAVDEMVEMLVSHLDAFDRFTDQILHGAKELR